MLFSELDVRQICQNSSHHTFHSNLPALAQHRCSSDGKTSKSLGVVLLWFYTLLWSTEGLFTADHDGCF